MAGNITRRNLLGGLAAGSLLAGCGRSRAPRYFGWLFVASAGERGIAVADLAEFRRVTTITMPQAPQQILLAGSKVFATCPDARAVCEIDPARFTVSRRVSLTGRIVASAVTPGGNLLVIGTDRPASIHLIEVPSGKVSKTIPLPDAPLSLDASSDRAAVTAGNAVIRILLRDGKLAGSTDLGLRAGIVRFRNDGNSLLVGAADRNQIVSVDAATGALLARMPLAFLPQRFCFASDGGQMFVSGTGEDSIAIVSPYQSEVDQTMIAGHQPFGLAMGSTQGRNLLFVTNLGSGDLSVFDIDTRGLASSVHIGGKPGEVLVTPDGGYALVVDRDTGDVSVVRMTVALNHERTAAVGQGTKPLFAVFPTGSAPQSAAIIPRPA